MCVSPRRERVLVPASGQRRVTRGGPAGEQHAPSLGLTVAERTHGKLAELSPSELKVGRALLAAYPAAGLGTVAEFAGRAHVSAPTVLRFASRIGFPSYPLFQQALIREVHEQLGSPLRRISEPHPPAGAGGPLPSAAEAYQRVLSGTFGALPEAEFSRAAALLSDPRKRVHLLGGRLSRVLAAYLTTYLVRIRKEVSLVPETEPERTATLLDLGRRHVLAVFDYRRYDPAIVRYAGQAAAHGAHVILFTDPWMSPAADVAEVVLPARVEAPSPFDSLVPAMAVVETLVAAVTEQLGADARGRLAGYEQLSGPDAGG
jgi:DNA-binding MurR/RpiR family transcriptional regulator